MNTITETYVDYLNEAILIEKVDSSFKDLASLMNKTRSKMGKFKDVDIEAKKKELAKDEKFQKIHKALKTSVKKDGSFDANKLKAGIKDYFNAAGIVFVEALTGGLYAAAISLLMVGPIRAARSMLFAFAWFILELTNLSADTLTKLITKTKVPLNKLRYQINREESTPILLDYLVSTLLLIYSPILRLLVSTPTLFILMAIFLFAKLIFRLYLGLKAQGKLSWKEHMKGAEKAKKKDKREKAKQAQESEEVKFTSYDTLLFLSSLREACVNSTSSIPTKMYLFLEATDYEILYYSIHESVPKNQKDREYAPLLEEINSVIGTKFESIFGREDSIGVASNFLSERFIEGNLFTNVFLNEAQYDQGNWHPKCSKSTMSKIELDIKKAKQAMADAMKDNLENDNAKTKEAYTKAGNGFGNAKERKNIYTSTGKDPGNIGNSDKGYSRQAQAGGWAAGFSGKMNIADLFAKAPGASSLASKLNISAAKAGGIIMTSGIVFAGLMIFASNKLKERFDSKAARACSKFAFKEKTICMKKYEVKALETRIKDVKETISYCSKTPQPDDCKKSLNGYVSSLERDKKTLEDYLKKAA